jgi:hypothetical protein
MDLAVASRHDSACAQDVAKIGGALMLPRSSCPLLVRTDFTSDEACQQSGATRAKCQDGFQAHVESVSDPAFDSVPWQVAKAALPPNDRGVFGLFVADRTTLTSHDRPILAVGLLDSRSKPPFRSIAAGRRPIGSRSARSRSLGFLPEAECASNILHYRLRN